MPQSKLRRAIAFPLHVLIVLPVLLQIVAIAAFVGILVFRNGQQTVESIARQLIEETSGRVVQELDAYLKLAQAVNRDHAAAFNAGAITLQNLDQLHRYLILDLRQHSSLTSLLFVAPDGNFRGVHRVEPAQTSSGFTAIRATEPPYEASIATPQMPQEVELYSVDAAGNLARPVFTLKDFEIRERAWYRQAVERGEPGVSEPFRIGMTDLLAVNIHIPIYDEAQALQGVFGVNLSLRQLSEFLNQLDLNESGAAFIVDSNGQLIADSVEGKLYAATVTPPDGLSSTGGDGVFRRLMASESHSALVSGAAKGLIAEFGHFKNIQTSRQRLVQIENKRHFLQVTPYRGVRSLDWFIVTVVPEYDFMGDIYSSLHRMALLGAVTLLGAIAICLRVAHRVTQPITRLSQSAQRFTHGDVVHQAHPTGIKEVNDLQQTFYQMASQLSELLTDLERQVGQRTVKLQRSEAGLKQAQHIAKMGSWIFNVATGKITWSEGLLWIYGLKQVEPPPSCFEFLTYLPPEERAALKRSITQTIEQGQPYEVEHRFIRPDGKTLYVTNRGEAVFDEQGQVVEVVGTVADISDRKQAEQQQQQYLAELAEWRERYEIAAQASGQVLFEYDVAADLDTWGPNTEEILGYRADQMPKRIGEYIALIHPEDQSRFNQLVAHVLTSREPYEIEFRFRKADGTYIWAKEQGITRFGDDGKAQQVIGYVADISDRKQLELDLQALATVDALTQVANRRKLETCLAQEWQRHLRTQRPLTIVMIDIDYFKPFNDRYGHPAGDSCLRQVAQALKATAHRPGDLVARYGGEEFMLLLSETDIPGAIAMADRIQAALADLAVPHLDSKTGHVTVSMGVLVVWVSDSITPDAAIAEADAALYCAKQTRNTYFIQHITRDPL